MGSALPYVVPSVCAFTYVVAAMMLKRASALGVGPWRIGFLANWAMFLLFLPWALLQPGSTGPLPETFWQPAINGLLFLGGQVFIFLALQQGDVSVTTPVMGTKVIMVAVLSLALRAGDVSWQLWAAALLSTGAVALLHFGEPRSGRTRVARTVFLSGMSALTYSVGDVLLQKWAGAWGSGRYLGLMFLCAATCSFAFVPFFRAPLASIDRRAWGWTAGGAFVLSATNMGIGIAIAVWRAATVVNILYSVRGLVSVAMVWAVGHWFANEEQHLTPRVFRARLAGAGLMFAAIVFVFI